MKWIVRAGRLTFILILLLATACADRQEEKSELVRYLEGIFHDPSFAEVPDRHFHASDFGAVGDERTINTAFIQHAIDSLSKTGGGVLVFEPGVYLTGALFLKENVDLHLGKDVTLKAIHDEAAYPDRWTRVAGIEMDWPAALINIYRQRNVRITGEGTIDGNGKYWWDKFWGDPPRSGGMWTSYNEKGVRWAVDYDCKRVRAVVVYESEDVLLKDFTVLRSGFWTVSLTYSTRVHVDGVIIRNNIGGRGPSSDGINTDSSRDILVENCDIDCNDDNLCIKSGRDSDGLRVNRPAENIVYRNSITRAGHGLFTLGSETSGGMRNIEVYGLRAVGTNTGIRFKSARVRGGLMENIWFHDIEMDSVASPFHFELDWYPSYSYPVIPGTFSKDEVPVHWITMTTPVEPPEKGIPEFRNLRFSRITALHSGKALHVNAFEEKPMQELVWEEIYVQAVEAGQIHHASNWRMKDVKFDISGNDQLDLVNCLGVELPLVNGEEYTAPSENGGKQMPGSATGEKEEDLVPEHLASELTQAMLITLDGKDRVAERGDTLHADTLCLLIPAGQWDDLHFYEPLGDGFYMGSLQIASEEGGRVLSVNGEHQHYWKIYQQEEAGSGNWLKEGVQGPVFRLALGK